MSKAVSDAIAEELWTYLKRHCKGQNKAIKESELAAAHGLAPRRLQHIIEHLVVNENRPIASSCRPPYGVFVAATAEEKERHARQLENRIIAIARRMRAFVKAPRVQVLEQREMFGS